MSVKDWVDRMRGKLRGVLQPNPDRYHAEIIVPGPPKPKSRHYIVTNTAGIREWISLHRVWFWTFNAIAGYVIFSIYVYSALLSADTRIEELSFWDNRPEDARNLILVIGGWLGVLAAIVGFVLAGFRTSTQMQMTQTAIDGQVTERFTKAVEQLGHEKRAVRLGAIYALERIARDSARDRDTIVETLAAYIRELAPWPPRHKDGLPYDDSDLEGEQQAIERNPMLLRPAGDVSAALTVICRMLPTGDVMRMSVDLRHTDLRGLDVPKIDLTQMRLDHTNLSEAKLLEANLASASLIDADLSRTILCREMLRATGSLRVSELVNASDLSEANLSWARMSRANLRGVNLYRTDLSGTDMSLVSGLINRQISHIRYHPDNPPKNLPEGLTLPEPNGP